MQTGLGVHRQPQQVRDRLKHQTFKAMARTMVSGRSQSVFLRRLSQVLGMSLVVDMPRLEMAVLVHLVNTHLPVCHTPDSMVLVEVAPPPLILHAVAL